MKPQEGLVADLMAKFKEIESKMVAIDKEKEEAGSGLAKSETPVAAANKIN